MYNLRYNPAIAPADHRPLARQLVVSFLLLHLSCHV